MKFNFDENIDRRGTHSVKLEKMKALFGRDDLLPLWVADMDFNSPPAIVDRAHLALNEGYMFGPGGEGFMRLTWVQSATCRKKLLIN